MKIEESIKYLENLRENEPRGLYITSLTYGIEALDKMIAKKPRETTIFEGKQAKILKEKGLENYKTYKCPICNKIVCERTVVVSIYPDGFIKQKYCDECGQKLDWGDEQEGKDD